MIQIGGFKVEEQIYESVNSRIFRGKRTSDNTPVIIKKISQDFPSPEEIKQFKQEYEVLSKLKTDGVVKAYALERDGNSVVLVLEDRGAESLRKIFSGTKLELIQFLEIGIQCAQVLGQIHAARIIHKDINPSNITFNVQDGKIQIIDFGIATHLSKENPVIKNPSSLEGTLPYISPEQTGRMNRSLDYRTDYYSLGVSFYELLTNEMPFYSDDPLEFIHAIITQEPKQVSSINPNVPEQVSRIIAKLLAKNAEDRYQSSIGIVKDLEQCLEQVKINSKIDLFPLGQYDVSQEFNIPQKLYGREKEVEWLLTHFEEYLESFRRKGLSATRQIPIMLVSGYSGIGKSVLVQELFKSITKQRGYYIAGKFDQLQKNVPYFAILKAFQELVRQLLSEPEEALKSWKQKIIRELGNNGAVITDVIKELELVIGEQPEVPELGPSETQNRFFETFQRFISVFAKPEHPLAIFLDDLQWADTASLKLLESLSLGEQVCIFIIGAYRDNEVNDSHPLKITLKEIKDRFKDEYSDFVVEIPEIKLNPLSKENIEELISDTLRMERANVRDLASLIHEKTGGNPFFTNEFLKSLYNEEYLVFDPNFDSKSGYTPWKWDLQRILGLNISDNVVELMTSKIQKLSNHVQYYLRIASCIGNRFSLEGIALITNEETKPILTNLTEAIQSGLVQPINENYKFIDLEIKYDGNAEFKFLHDRIQQAAYTLIPVEEKSKVHWEIGNFLLSKASEEELDDHLFDIVNHINQGLVHIKEEDKIKIANLNLKATSKAKLSAAYETAISYGKTGLGLLGLPTSKEAAANSDKSFWTKNYDLVFSLYFEIAEASYINTNYEECEELVEIILPHCKDILATTKISEIRIRSLIAQNKLIEALDTSFPILDQLGFKFPRRPNKLHVAKGLLGAIVKFSDKKLLELAKLPKLDDPKLYAGLNLLATISASAYLAMPDLNPLILFQALDKTFKKGVSDISPILLAGYIIILCAILGKLDVGYKLCQAVLIVYEKNPNPKFYASILVMMNLFGVHWKESMGQTIKNFMEAYKIALQTGDLTYAGYAIFNYIRNSFYSGKELSQLNKEAAVYSKKIKSMRQESALWLSASFCQITDNLLGKVEDPSILSGEFFDREEDLKRLKEQKDNSSIINFYLQELILSYLFGKYEVGIKSAKEYRKFIDSDISTINVPIFHFYEGLNLSNLIKKPSGLSYWKFKSNLNKMKFYHDKAPLNHEHRYYLLLAEQGRLENNSEKAELNYDKALELAKAKGFPNDEAICAELAGKYYLSRGRRVIATHYLMNAYNAYNIWGATAKLRQMETVYQGIQLKRVEAKGATTFAHTTISNSSTTVASTSVTKNSNEAFDLASVMKAAQSMSGEIVLDKLLRNLMSTLLQNAGADRGILILESKKKFFAEAIYETGKSPQILESIAIDGSTLICPTSMIYFVVRSKENVVIDDAIVDTKYGTDAYIQEAKPRSVMCTPLMTQGKVVGVLYLENKVSTGAFTKERLRILNLLSSQAAISIENARLYANMSELNSAYQRFVPEEFLKFLNRESIVDVKLGDQIRKEMSVLFSDIRSFTELSEKMTPEENFNFINSYLKRMGPSIRENNGFIDKYIGDAIMALFPRNADDAIKASIDMMKGITLYNQHRKNQGYGPISIGIGIHTGELMLGTVGEDKRMDTTVISDAVNLSSRLESMTKQYGVGIIISEDTLNKMQAKEKYKFRLLDTVVVKGKTLPVVVYEVLDYYPEDILKAKLASKEMYEKAVQLFYAGSFVEAKQLFDQVLLLNKEDKATQVFLERVDGLMKNLDQWKGYSKLTEK
ncbi:MAG TPA: AAA family ATPase [Leptospiraceae bacterium]|nr:AAA family ATPase [Leptospiraceae bacterium]HMW04300.1 AAA family ATPase [Leptospiraceae bacterium]HMX30646.1 AAA family ATPase [Leptospiraceae bacterium]HMY31346.1 AAA family ATPase [Leptospiraceae bacterium]HMZ63617.1 AAA family ATPase [Leptospiraceae bacterium]